MNRSWIIICLAYILGLLSTNLLTVSGSGFTGQQLSLLVVGLSISALVCAIALNKIRVSSQVWSIAGIVAIGAVIYFQLRIPQPDKNDISYQVAAFKGEVVTVVGKVTTEPRLNASQKLKFELKAEEINDSKSVSGKLYVTIPLLQGTGINLGEAIKLRGILYLPQPASYSGGFDFKAYLARQGIFAGMQGFEVIEREESEPKWGWWKLRRRIVQSHLRGLGSPVGQVVSSMVLGRKAVDLPMDIRDRFIEAGLAHVLAASGFHVSLLLGLILKLTNRFSSRSRFVIGIFTLLVYLGLTGIQASVLRACLMGSAILLALAMDTKVKPLGLLLLVATIILLLNPLLIGDLSFQLSFLATFGLIVTIPELQTRLEWLPPAIASLVAVPLAASVWVLPLISYQFNNVATYSIIVNIICTPLIAVISLGGMVSAIAALILPVAGSAIAWLLLYPTLLLITLINFFTNLPGSSWAIGHISLGVLLIIYGLLILVWLNQWCAKNWRLALLFVLALITIPIGYKHFNLTQITVLPTQPPVIAIQDRGKTILVNSGNSKAIKYTVLPFLKQQGINHLDHFIALNPELASDWIQISDRLSIDNIIDYSQLSTQIEPAINTNSLKISFASESWLKIETVNQNWLILNDIQPNTLKIQQYIRQNKLSQKPTILVSNKIITDWLQLNPQTIIGGGRSPKQMPNNYYNLQQDGTITWTPQNGFARTHKLDDNIF